jgi:hypothetical protein
MVFAAGEMDARADLVQRLQIVFRHRRGLVVESDMGKRGIIVFVTSVMDIGPPQGLSSYPDLARNQPDFKFRSST